MNQRINVVEPDVIESAQSLAHEAIETIAAIMRKSSSERMRMLAAMAILDRSPRGSGQSLIVRSGGQLPAIESKGDMRARVLAHFSANSIHDFDAARIKAELELRSPEQAIRVLLVQLHRDGALERLPNGRFMARKS